MAQVYKGIATAELIHPEFDQQGFSDKIETRFDESKSNAHSLTSLGCVSINFRGKQI